MGNKFSKAYSESWNYLKSCSKQIWIGVGIFLLFAIIGFFVPAPEYLSNEIMKYIGQILLETQGFGFWELFVYIFFNNFKSSFFGLFGGIVFGIFPFLMALSNGYLLGFVSSFTVAEFGSTIIWRLVPHGIFELPAVFISLGMGLKLGTFVLKKEKKEFLKKHLNESFKVFLLIVLPLLVIAAIIEGILISFI